MQKKHWFDSLREGSDIDSQTLITSHTRLDEMRRVLAQYGFEIADNGRQFYIFTKLKEMSIAQFPTWGEAVQFVFGQLVDEDPSLARLGLQLDISDVLNQYGYGIGFRIHDEKITPYVHDIADANAENKDFQNWKQLLTWVFAELAKCGGSDNE